MNTTIAISKNTRDLLQDFGKKSEKYDDIIKRLLNNTKLQEKLMEFVSEEEFSSLEEARKWTELKLKNDNY